MQRNEKISAFKSYTMSLDNFQMPPFVATELYKNYLVDVESETPTIKTLEERPLTHLGIYHKNILVIVNQDGVEYLDDGDKKFLIDILGACKLTLDDLALVNYNGNPGLSYQQIQKVFKPEIILCLGIGPETLKFPLEFPQYQVQRYNQQVYLHTPSLKMLAEDKNAKRQLWECLKKIFTI